VSATTAWYILRVDVPGRLIVETLREGKPIRFVARGASMWPAIPDGSLVEAVPCSWDRLSPGNIGVFEGASGVVVHRVRSVRTGAVEFAGDALGGPDELVAAARVLGRARVISRRPLRLRVPTRRHLQLAARWGWRSLGRLLRSLLRQARTGLLDDAGSRP
jgi:signal peptidase